MVKVNMEFEVDGEKQLSRFFDSAVEDLSDFQDVFKGWGEDFRETQDKVFQAEGAFEGRSKWQELSPRYRRWKETNYPGASILKLTGRLWKSLTEKSHTDHIAEYDETEFKIGTEVDYGIFHQRGQGVPQRKVIELTEPQKKRWVQITRKTMWSKLQKSSERHNTSGR